MVTTLGGVKLCRGELCIWACILLFDVINLGVLIAHRNEITPSPIHLLVQLLAPHPHDVGRRAIARERDLELRVALRRQTMALMDPDRGIPPHAFHRRFLLDLEQRTQQALRVHIVAPPLS